MAAGLAAPDPQAFSKVDTSIPWVLLGPTDMFIILHWGNGGNTQPYQLFDVTSCAPGYYHLPSPRVRGGGLSWIGRIVGDGETVPDGGATLIMLGLALCGLVPASKLLSRKN